MHSLRTNFLFVCLFDKTCASPVPLPSPMQVTRKEEKERKRKTDTNKKAQLGKNVVSCGAGFSVKVQPKWPP